MHSYPITPASKLTLDSGEFRLTVPRLMGHEFWKSGGHCCLGYVLSKHRQQTPYRQTLIHHTQSRLMTIQLTTPHHTNQSKQKTNI